MIEATNWQEKLLRVNSMEENELWLIERIQLDAFKAGAEWAAQFCEDQTFAAGGKRDLNEISYDTACIDCQKIIQEEASNLNEIPK